MGRDKAPAIVQCVGLTKAYRTEDTVTQALRGVDLEIRAGELMMLVGPSGCGKTTLISIIAAILNHDSGSCIVDARDISTMRERERAAFRGHNLGFVFQAFNLIPTLTCVENVAVPLLLQGMPWNDALLKAGRMVERVGLGEKKNIYPSHLSGGQQQRVAIARALVHDPKIVVCDEPTSALDQATGHIIMELFREVALAGGRTVIIVTHDSRIFSFADRIAQMNDGQIVAIGTPSQILQSREHHA